MLTDKQIRAAAPQNRPYRLSDGQGLSVQVQTNGSKLWRYRYELGGKEKLLALGAYPEVSLAAARDKRDAARALVREGRDPSVEKRLQREAKITALGNTFETVARAWHSRMAEEWTPTHSKDVIQSLENGVFKRLGPLPISEITPPMVLGAIQDIERNAR